MNFIKILATTAAGCALAVSGAIAQPFFSQQAPGEHAYPEHLLPEYLYPVPTEQPRESGLTRAEVRDDVLQAQAVGELTVMRDYEVPTREDEATSTFARREVRRDAMMAGLDARFDNIYYFN